MTITDSGPEPVAVIGSSCRFPGGLSSPSKLWEFLQKPQDLLSDIPSSCFNPRAFYHENAEHHGTSNVTKSYMLDEDRRVFDYSFFNINPKEAESMDPQHRILLETVYEGIESAGYSMQKLQGSATAVYVGQMTADYYDVLSRDIESMPQYMVTGTSRCITSNRVSYFFDWKGPSVTLDTACSSSLVAVHQAVQELRRGQSTLAIAAGVNLILGPELYIAESKLHMLSPTGRSRMWDAGADGYARGEGFAAIVLKPLSQAIADGDDIECIIRETGVNQDGRTAGITMPSVSSQSSLIRSTYQRCGLDCSSFQDRCQYFEAHGTGTLAGDPVEAEAVRNAFFGEPLKNPSEGNDSEDSNVLYVGSVKTVIGHLEGSAGLAGLLKASLAVQHGLIPPNMHFQRLNPKIEPFYQHLRVPTEATPWPSLPDGAPRRASVNSFGFGGTNCHAIIESWRPTKTATSDLGDTSQIPFGPFTISAKSDSALYRSATALARTLEAKQDELELDNLAYTLQMHRSEFGFKASFSATTCTELRSKIQSALSHSSNGDAELSGSIPSIHVTKDLPPRILGVFTGQGAQWPRMGADLYKHSAAFRQSILDLECSLADLPEPPAWSLTAELLAPPETSRVDEAAISQPLCTALQIALVDLLAASGIKFSAVVGHSSGEIAAVYAAGYINASDAVRIAYYRGLHANIESDVQVPGLMMAVGMGFEDARAFCHRDNFRGRIVAAASNSRSSTTLSGDADAIEEAKNVLDSEGIFARVLKVQKAYHSHHMNACAGPYLDSLRQCNIAIERAEGQGDCEWFSSVYGPEGRSIDDPAALRDTYWVKNLAQPVLFSQALDRAVMESYCFDLVLEVGPHAALKGPASETIRGLTGVIIPYTGTLARQKNDLNTFSDALGFVWSRFQSPSPVVDFQGFRKACTGDDKAPKPSLIKGLPTYAWDHDRPLWKEPRVSRAYRERKNPPHELLGTATSNGDNQEMRWRNIMKLNEMEWLRGHQFQNQVLFPAAGYVSMAVEAAMRLGCEGQEDSVQLVELEDLIIHQAITLEDNSSGTEVILVIRAVERTPTTITAQYTCYSGGVDGASHDADKVNFTGRATVTLGELPVPDALPAREAPSLPMSELDLSRFYTSLEDIGLRYSGDFLVESASRRLGTATVAVRRVESPLKVHPATLDAAFHGIFAAYCFPGDGRLWTTFLPTSINRVRVDVSAQHPYWTESSITADCYLTSTTARTISGDVNLYSGQELHPEVQIEGLTCTSFERDLERFDRKSFAQTSWVEDISTSVLPEAPWSSEQKDLSTVIERVIYFYLRKLRDEISPDEIPNLQWHFQCLMSWALDHVLPRVELGEHPRVRAEWKDDTPAMIASWQSQYRGHVDMDLVTALGESLPAIVRGTLPTLQVMMANDMLNRLYKEGLGFTQANHHMAGLVSRFAHRYPSINVLEIGAGTGGTTINALPALSPQFKSYTYTDISPGFFENARALFHDYSSRMIFKVLDVERNPMDQGYEENSYDLIIASNVLHATKVLATTLQNCRRLLKPGGYLLLLEITSSDDTIRPGFLMGGLPGWWLGRDDGRVHGPTISESQWDTILMENGFSGVDTACRDFSEGHFNTVMATQAVDDRVNVLRDPLSMTAMSPGTGMPSISSVQDLVIVGGKSLNVGRLIRSVKRQLQSIATDIRVVHGLEDFAENHVPSGAVTLCLTDLDEPAWKSMTESKFKGMKNLILGSRHLLWVTRGRLASEPYSNMTIGMGRSIMSEVPHSSLQFLDLDNLGTTGLEASTLSEALLRIVYLDNPNFKNVLWSVEHELCIEKGRILIPRIIPDDDLNDRLNAQRRPIHKAVDLATASVEIVQQGDSITLVQSEQHELTDTKQSCKNTAFRVLASSLFPFSTRDHRSFFVCLGLETRSGRKALFLSPKNTSVVCVSPEEVVEWDSQLSDEEAFQSVLAHLVADSLCYEVDGSLWVHEADDLLARCLLQISEGRRMDIFLSTSLSKGDPLRSFIHPRTPVRELRRILPSGATRMIDAGHGNNELFESILKSSYGNGYAHIQQVFMNVGCRKTVSLPFTHQDIERRLVEACQQAYFHPSSGSENTLPTGITGVHEINDFSCADIGPVHVVSWRVQEPISALIQSLELPGLFSNKKTYFLVGLTGEVGLSICDWMVKHGARYLAVTSRNPNVPPSVIEDFKRKGATIRVFSLDVSDRAALFKVHAEICATMPPIAGVANAAMVLHDKAFENATLDHFNVVLGPKVQGSKNLDELFSTTKLDFFILFSSLACVVGSKGQSNYGAANLFMHTLAHQRRGRGVAASIIDIAMLLGVGYVARSIDQYESQMRRYSYMAISEPEFHSIFAAAILSGKPESNHSPELIIGLGADADAPWSKDPRFSNYVRNEQKSAEVAQSKESSKSVLSQLAVSKDSTEALEIMVRSFSKKVELILQLATESLDPQEPLVRLGIDSLVAVELRSWFLKELNIDMPVLKILNGASVSDLCKDALGRLSGSSRAADAGGGGLKPAEPSGSSSPSVPMSSAESNSGMVTPNTEPLSNSQSSLALEGLPQIAATAPNVEMNGFAGQSYERVGPASSGQSRLFFMQEYREDKSSFTVLMLGKTQRTVNLTRLEKALADVARNHEVLRSAIFMNKSSGEVVQGVQATSGITFEHKIIKGPEDLDAEMKAHEKFAFDLAKGQVLKFLVLSESPTRQYILVCFHHIVLDSVSGIVFLKDLDTAYTGGTLTPPTQQAIDLCVKQKANNNPSKDKLDFWGSMFKSSLAPMPLMPFSRVTNRQVMRPFKVVYRGVVLDPQITSRVKVLSARLNVTPFHVYLSTLVAFLSRCLGIQELPIGFMDSNRADVEDAVTVGYFMNTLPLRYALQKQSTFASLVQQTRDMVFAALTNASPLSSIVEHLNVPRSADHHPLFQATLNYRLDNSTRSNFGDVPVEWIDGTTPSYPYDLKLDVNDTPDGTRLLLITQKYLYDASDANRILQWYERALTGFLSDPNLPIGSCCLSTPQDEVDCITLGRGPQSTVSWPSTLAHRIFEMASLYPESTAVKDASGHSLTYSAMMGNSQQIAASLQNTGARPGARVVVFLTSVADVASALIATMRLGLVYVPVDPRKSPDILHTIVSDCEPSIILCHGTTMSQVNRLASRGITVINIEDPVDRKLSDDDDTEIFAEPDQDGFIIYTSNPEPMGVLLTHSAVVSDIWSMSSEFGLARETVLQHGELGSSMSLKQILIALANGGTLILAPQDVESDAAGIARAVRTEGVTLTALTPSEYFSVFQHNRDMLKTCSAWRFAFSHGEKMTSRLRSAFRDLALPSLGLFNLYTAPELGLLSIGGKVNYLESVSDTEEGVSGRVMPNCSVLVVDHDLKPLPVGYPGEIVISGVGLAKGYVNRPGEESRRFIENPVSLPDDISRCTRRHFRSGDKGRILEDGSVEVIGPLDGGKMVNIRGHPALLDDIAPVIVREGSPFILDAAVSWREGPGVLVAFITFAEEPLMPKETYLDHLRVKLPLSTNLIPDHIVSTGSIPLTLDGQKNWSAIDDLAIPEKVGDSTSTTKISLIENRVKRVWEAVLPSGQALNLETDSDFFHVGGNSFLLINLQSGLQDEFGSRLAIPDMFQFRTIRGMARRILADEVNA
ncbi:hypothetical protein N0V93_008915 [Gnomoniopsis smithogilvyi]|uniref:Polyketide synthase n=1 Tax=Gnomoniopsis smithogilvyi TaxID=1191159 RepID=A0A9W9CTA3_9PEZI|nr:hypothetical protein N0V93_008915 [Gnomoniopsis smithogilvyi]